MKVPIELLCGLNRTDLLFACVVMAATASKPMSGLNGGTGCLPGIDPFDPNLSISQIFGDHMTGSALLDSIFNTYQVGEKVRLKFFLDNNTPDNDSCPFSSRQQGIARHSQNQRKHAGIKRAYIKSCQARGIVPGVRGECWVSEPLPDQFGRKSGPFLALSFGSLTEAFFASLQIDPTNELLLRTLQRGMEARIFTHKMPESVVKYLVKLHNRFHFGAGVSFIELMQTVPDVAYLHVASTLNGIILSI